MRIDVRQFQQTNQELTHGAFDTRTDIIYFVVAATLEQQRICGRRVAHLSEIASDVDVAHAQYRLATPFLNPS